MKRPKHLTLAEHCESLEDTVRMWALITFIVVLIVSIFYCLLDDDGGRALGAFIGGMLLFR